MIHVVMLTVKAFTVALTVRVAVLHDRTRIDKQPVTVFTVIWCRSVFIRLIFSKWQVLLSFTITSRARRITQFDEDV